MFRNQNIRPGLMDTQDVLYIDPKYEQTHKNKRLKVGDLLTARTSYPGITRPSFEDLMIDQMDHPVSAASWRSPPMMKAWLESGRAVSVRRSRLENRRLATDDGVHQGFKWTPWKTPSPPPAADTTTN